MKKFLKPIALTVIISLLLSGVYFQAECKEISNEVFRLHILANSNSGEDQTLKLELRDYILNNTQNIFKNSETKEDTIKIVESNTKHIQEISKSFIKSKGYDYEVNVQVDYEYFSTRIYDTFMMPAGKYDALKITIGSGNGENWWCVMYPPVCLPAAQNNEELENVLDEEQMEIVENENQFEIKFKVVEIFESVLDFFNNL